MSLSSPLALGLETAAVVLHRHVGDRALGEFLATAALIRQTGDRPAPAQGAGPAAYARVALPRPIPPPFRMIGTLSPNGGVVPRFLEPVTGGGPGARCLRRPSIPGVGGCGGAGTDGMAEPGSTPANASPMTNPATSSSCRARSSGPRTAGTPPASRTSWPAVRSAAGSSPHIATVTGA